MTIKAQILAEFEAGKEPKEVAETYSSKTVYKYYRLHLVLKIKERLQRIADTDDFETLDVPRLRVLLKEVKKW